MIKTSSKKIKKTIIGCAVAGGVVGLVLGWFAAAIGMGMSCGGNEVIFKEGLIFCIPFFSIVGAVFGGFIPLSISVANSITRKYSKAIRVTSIILAILVVVGFTYFFGYIWGKIWGYFAFKIWNYFFI